MRIAVLWPSQVTKYLQNTGKIEMKKIVVALVLLTSLSGCGGSSSDSGTETPLPLTQNQIPLANAGPDITVDEGTTVQLTGIGSDTDGSTVYYKWEQSSGGTVVELDTTDTAVLEFTAPDIAQDTSVSFTLTVTDSDGATAKDTVEVLIKFINQLPSFTMDVTGVVLYPYIDTEIFFNVSDPDSNISQLPMASSAVGALQVISINENSIVVRLNDQPDTLDPVTLSLSIIDEAGGEAKIVRHISVETDIGITHTQMANQGNGTCVISVIGFDCWNDPDKTYWKPDEIEKAIQTFKGRKDIVNFSIDYREVCVITDVGQIECVTSEFSPSGSVKLSSYLEQLPQYHYTDINFVNEFYFSAFLVHTAGIVTIGVLDNGELSIDELTSEVEPKKIVSVDLWGKKHTFYKVLMANREIFCSDTPAGQLLPCEAFAGEKVLSALKFSGAILMQTVEGIKIKSTRTAEYETIPEIISHWDSIIARYFTDATFHFAPRSEFYRSDSINHVYFEQNGSMNVFYLSNSCGNLSYISDYEGTDLRNFEGNCKLFTNEVEIDMNIPFKSDITVATPRHPPSVCKISLSGRIFCEYPDGSEYTLLPDYLKDHSL
jgi:hypothetical protein